MVKPALVNSVSEVLVKVEPEMVNDPLPTIFFVPPTNVPELSVAPDEPIVSEKLPCLNVPV